MKRVSRFALNLLILLSTSIGYTAETSTFPTIIDDFSFTTLSGHRVNYSIASDKLSIISPDGITLASGKPFVSRSALMRRGYFEHVFSIYSTNDGRTLEYAMILRTKLKLPESSGSALDPINAIDTKILVSTSFWITDTATEAEILNSSLYEGEVEISKSITINYGAGSCRGLFN